MNLGWGDIILPITCMQNAYVVHGSALEMFLSLPSLPSPHPSSQPVLLARDCPRLVSRVVSKTVPAAVSSENVQPLAPGEAESVSSSWGSGSLARSVCSQSQHPRPDHGVCRMAVGERSGGVPRMCLQLNRQKKMADNLKIRFCLKNAYFPLLLK